MFRYYTTRAYLASMTSWMFAFLCFGYPISAIFSFIIGVSSTPINIAYRSINLFIALYVIFISVSLYKNRLSKYVLPLVGFLLMYLFRIMYDTLFRGLPTDHTLLEIYSFYVGCIFFPAFAIVLSIKYVNLEILILRIFYILGIANILLLYFYLSQHGWTISRDNLLERALITGLNEKDLLINPISFGQYGGYLFLLCSTLLFIFKPNYSKKTIKIIWFFLLLGLVNLILGNSRGPFIFGFLGFIFVFSVYFAQLKLNIHSFFRLSFYVVLFLVGLFGLSNKITSNNIELGIFGRLERLQNNIETGEKETRNDLFDEGIDMFMDYPIFGDQFVLKSTGAYPHNVIVEVLMGLGLVGFIVYALIFMNLIGKFIAFKNHPKHYIPLMCMFSLTIGVSLTSGCLYQGVESWNMLAILLAIPPQKNNNITLENTRVI